MPAASVLFFGLNYKLLLLKFHCFSRTQLKTCLGVICNFIFLVFGLLWEVDMWIVFCKVFKGLVAQLHLQEEKEKKRVYENGLVPYRPYEGLIFRLEIFFW
jgi:hypothetical protein